MADARLQRTREHYPEGCPHFGARQCPKCGAWVKATTYGTWCYRCVGAALEALPSRGGPITIVDPAGNVTLHQLPGPTEVTASECERLGHVYGRDRLCLFCRERQLAPGWTKTVDETDPSITRYRYTPDECRDSHYYL